MAVRQGSGMSLIRAECDRLRVPPLSCATHEFQYLLKSFQEKKSGLPSVTILFFDTFP